MQTCINFEFFSTKHNIKLHETYFFNQIEEILNSIMPLDIPLMYRLKRFLDYILVLFQLYIHL